MSDDPHNLEKPFVKFSWVTGVSPFTLSAHGAQRRDGAGDDLYVRIGLFVIGLPHLWRPIRNLKELAADRLKLIRETRCLTGEKCTNKADYCIDCGKKKWSRDAAAL